MSRRVSCSCCKTLVVASGFIYVANSHSVFMCVVCLLYQILYLMQQKRCAYRPQFQQVYDHPVVMCPTRAIYNKTCCIFAQVTRKGAAESSEKYKGFIQVTQIEDTKIVDAAYYSTLCSTCQVVCHDKCQLDEYGAPGKTPACNHVLCSGLVLPVADNHRSASRAASICASLQVYTMPRCQHVLKLHM